MGVGRVCVCVLIVATPWDPSLGEHPRGAKVSRCDPPSEQADATPPRLRQWPSRRRPAPRGSGGQQGGGGQCERGGGLMANLVQIDLAHHLLKLQKLFFQIADWFNKNLL